MEEVGCVFWEVNEVGGEEVREGVEENKANERETRELGGQTCARTRRCAERESLKTH